MANADYPAAVQEMDQIQAAAGTLGLDVATFEIRRAEDIAPAFEVFNGRAEAALCRPTGKFSSPSESLKRRQVPNISTTIRSLRHPQQ
jgi:hypothetical protein